MLFLIQFIVCLWVPFYNKVDPAWIGIPFFYWYQLLWVIIGAVLTAIVYFATDSLMRRLFAPGVDGRQVEIDRENRRARAELDRSHHLRAAVLAHHRLGFVAAHWRKGDLDQLHEWGLGGRRFGTLITWFLIGGDLYTAYTFVAVPALAFGAGAIAFFAVPYAIMIYPILFLVFPRLWYVCHKHNYITAADFVRGRFGNRWLALAIAITGIVATMPYIALQLVGLQVVIGGMGVSGSRLYGRFAAGYRLHHSGGLHLYERTAGAGLDRDRQGHSDLPHRLCGHHNRADAHGRLRHDLRKNSAGEAVAGASRPPTRPVSTASMRRWRSARRWRCSFIRTPSPAF